MFSLCARAFETVEVKSHPTATLRRRSARGFDDPRFRDKGTSTDGDRSRQTHAALHVMAFCSLFCLHPPFHHGSHPSSTVSSPCAPQLQLCSISRPRKYRLDRARYFRCGGFLPSFPHVTAYPCDIPLGSTLVVSGTEPGT